MQTLDRGCTNGGTYYQQFQLHISLHAPASPSMMQERERSRASASTISGKRSVRSLPGG